MLVVWIIVSIYMFYGLAHVCEEFLLPGLNLLCERKHIPDDVAGATLMAAGCNAPELFASMIGVFVDHSTVGAGTVIGSAVRAKTRAPAADDQHSLLLRPHP